MGRRPRHLSPEPTTCATASGTWWAAATAANNIGEIKSDQGHYEEAASLFDDSYAITSSAGALFLANLARSNLGRLAARRGQVDEAEALLRDALAGFEEIKARSFVLETNARLAEHAVLAGKGSDALRQADETLVAVDEAGGAAGLVPMVHRLRGYALMQTGDLDGAAAAVDESVRAARETGGSYELALSLEARVRLASLRCDVGSRGGGGERCHLRAPRRRPAARDPVTWRLQLSYIRGRSGFDVVGSPAELQAEVPGWPR